MTDRLYCEDCKMGIIVVDKKHTLTEEWKQQQIQFLRKHGEHALCIPSSVQNAHVQNTHTHFLQGVGLMVLLLVLSGIFSLRGNPFLYFLERTAMPFMQQFGPDTKEPVNTIITPVFFP